MNPIQIQQDPADALKCTPSTPVVHQAVNVSADKLEHLRHNESAHGYVRSTTASIAGALAGVLGLHGSAGVVWYFASFATPCEDMLKQPWAQVSSLLVGLVILLYNTQLKPERYFKSGALEAVTKGLMDNALGYALCECVLMRLSGRLPFFQSGLVSVRSCFAK
jgi:hypothetical protein